MADSERLFEEEKPVDVDAELRAHVEDLFEEIEKRHGKRPKRIELEHRADHTAIYATFLSHLREP